MKFLKNTREHAVHALDLLEGKRIDYRDFLRNKIEEELIKGGTNEQLRYKELIKLIKEKSPKIFVEGVKLFHDQLKKREEEAVEYLNRETVQRCEKAVNRLIEEVAHSVDDRTDESEDQGLESVREKWRVEVEKIIMEVMQRNVKALKNRVKDETQKIEEEAIRLLSHEIIRRKDGSWQRRFIELDPIEKDIIQQLEERIQYTERKCEKLFKEAYEYLENVNERVREHAVKRVTEMVALIVQETLRSALKYSVRSEQKPTMEASPKWATEALFFLMKSFQTKQVSRVSYLELAG